MRVVSVIDTLKYGGAESVAVNLICGMPVHRHILAHCSSFFHEAPSPYLIEKAVRSGAKTSDIPFTPFEASVNADVVFYHWWGNDPLAMWRQNVHLARSDRPKFICVIHCIKPDKKVPPDFDHYIAVSKAAGQAQDHIPKDKKTVIYNGVDVEKFSACHRARKQERFVVGMLNHLTEKKVPADWKELVIAPHIENIRFIIAGDGPKRKQMMNDAEMRGLADVCSFPGHIEPCDVPELLSSFDIACHLSNSEAHALTLIEYAVAGLPVVALWRGGIPEQVVHGETGFLCNDMREMKKYCELLAKDGNLHRRLSGNARTFGSQFTIERQCREYERLCQDMFTEAVVC